MVPGPNDRRLRYNVELELLHWQRNVVEATGSKRLQWARHVWRTTKPRIISYSNGRRGIFRPLGSPTGRRSLVRHERTRGLNVSRDGTLK